jgi:hypothetical protein
VAVRGDDGATTIWERWDSMLPDGSINPGEMTSFNHYAFGAVADWLHRTVAGLAPAAPGYRTLRIAPRPGPGITSAAATHEAPYGPAEVSWTLSGGRGFRPRGHGAAEHDRRGRAARRERAGRGRLGPALAQRDHRGAAAGGDAGAVLDASRVTAFSRVGCEDGWVTVEAR